MSKKKVSIVPFTKRDYSLLEIMKGLDEYEITSIISPNGVSFSDIDVSYLENRIAMGLKCSVNLDSMLNTDVVFITKAEMNTALYRYALEAIKIALEANIGIVCFMELEQSFYLSTVKNCEIKKIDFVYAYDDFTYEKNTRIDLEIYRPQIPIVAIGELSDNVDGDEVFFKVVNTYENQGYRVFGISNSIYSILKKNLKKLPRSVDKSNVDVVYEYSQFLKNEIFRRKPNIIVFQFPFPMLSYSENISYDFGISSYILSKVIFPSCFICCGTYGQLMDSFWDDIEKNFFARYGFGIDVVHISNKVIDIDNDEVSREINYITESQKCVIEAINNNEYSRNFMSVTGMPNEELYLSLRKILDVEFYSLS